MENVGKSTCCWKSSKWSWSVKGIHSQPHFAARSSTVTQINGRCCRCHQEMAQWWPKEAKCNSWWHGGIVPLKTRFTSTKNSTCILKLHCSTDWNHLKPPCPDMSRLPRLPHSAQTLAPWHWLVNGYIPQPRYSRYAVIYHLDQCWRLVRYKPIAYFSCLFF